MATGDLAVGDFDTTDLVLGVAVTAVAAEDFATFLTSLLPEAFLPLRLPVDPAPLAVAAILIAPVFAAVAFTAVPFEVAVFFASLLLGPLELLGPLDLPTGSLADDGLVTTFLLGAALLLAKALLLGANFEMGELPFFAELFTTPLASEAPFDGFTPLAEDEEEAGCLLREAPPPEPVLAWDLVFDFVGFLAGGTGVLLACLDGTPRDSSAPWRSRQKHFLPVCLTEYVFSSLFCPHSGRYAFARTHTFPCFSFGKRELRSQ